MKLLKLFSLTLFLALALHAPAQQPDYSGLVIRHDSTIEKWPADGESLNWVSGLSIGEGSFFQVPQRKETYLVGFNYYRGFTLREAGVVLVETDAFLYDLPQGSIDDRLMNDALVALLKRGIRVDITRRGEWLEIGPWSKPTNRAMIFDTRNIKSTPRE